MPQSNRYESDSMRALRDWAQRMVVLLAEIRELNERIQQNIDNVAAALQ